MGCLNSNQGFSHWFANIHLSGPCNRKCYFCIGQHMMALDSLNNLDVKPEDMPGMEEFIAKCLEHNVSEVNLTGSNTDPLMYKHIYPLSRYLRKRIPNLVFGCRTNGALLSNEASAMTWNLSFNKASISIPTFRPDVYRAMMGNGSIPNLAKIIYDSPFPIKVNVVLGPENIDHVEETIRCCKVAGIKKVNLREPYGQPHIGDPLINSGYASDKRLGMAKYDVDGVDVTYWDVHYVEVESVNLYANGRVSVTYPITKGHSPDGSVLGQVHFPKSGRVREQWVKE